MADDSNVVAGCPAQSTTVSHLLLNVAHNGTFGHRSKGKDVSDGQSSVLSSVDELAGVHAFVGDEGLGVELESVGVTKNDLCERRTTSRVVDNVLHYTTNVSVSLGIIVGPELRRGFVQTGALVKLLVVVAVEGSFARPKNILGGEDRSATFPLVPMKVSVIMY